MKPSLWRTFAVLFGIVLLGLTAMDVAAGLFANADFGLEAKTDASHPGTYVVTRVTDPRAVEGTAHAGDRVRLADQSPFNRARFRRERPGERFALVGTSAAGRPLRYTVVMLRQGIAPPTFWLFMLVRALFVVVGIAVSVRRPEDAGARALVGLFYTFGVLFEGTPPWFPAPALVALTFVYGFFQVYAAYAALDVAVSFPTVATHGIRRRLARANPWCAAAVVIVISVQYVLLAVLLRPIPAALTLLGITCTLGYFAAITVAFVVAIRSARGADRKRAQWVAWAIGVGFSGTVVQLVMIALHVPVSVWGTWTSLTLTAIPLGLGYAIVRHRVVDIGFVVNRAIVFGTISAIVVLAFMVLEWALSTLFVRISHVTSTSLELALALGLGFSLRFIHERVDRVVDDLFFRRRHEADAALRTFAREVTFVTDPRVAVARTHGQLSRHAGATACAIYVVDGTTVARLDPGEDAAPAQAGIDDPALVRMRASRAPVALRKLDSTLVGEWAFPMTVRGALAGVVVLGPKANGDAYAPDEVATIECVALALANALDALQTAALKAEIARVLVDGASTDALRRTLDPTAWLRGALPQPAGLLGGRVE